MGVQINPQNSIISGARPDASRSVSPAQSAPKSTAPGTPAPPPLPKAGFGEGTASQATAAYVTLGRGLYSARQLVPTTEDIRAELRTRLSEARVRREVAAQERDRRAAELQRAETEPALRADASSVREPQQEAAPQPQAVPQAPPEAPTPQPVQRPETLAAPAQPPPLERPSNTATEPPGSRLDLSV